MTLVSRLAQLEQAATPGPWRADDTHLTDAPTKRCVRASKPVYATTDIVALIVKDDAELIAAMRNALPECLAALRMQERLVECQKKLCVGRYGDISFSADVQRILKEALDGAAVQAKE